MGTQENTPDTFRRGLTGGDIALCSTLYLGLGLLIHFPGIADYLGASLSLVAQYPTREGGLMDLIADTMIRSTTMSVQLIGYALTVLLLNLLPLLLLLASVRALVGMLPRIGLSKATCFLIAVVCFWAAVLAFNKLFFPRSSFALLLPIEGARMLWWTGTISLVVYATFGLVPAFWWLARMMGGLVRTRTALAALGVFLVVGMTQPLYSRWTLSPESSDLPDIILIGLDSVSPRHLERHPGALPELERWLQQAAVFENTLTPLGRTFPAWTSILTAKYPVNSGARANLTEFSRVETDATLPRFFKSRGYTTIYAQDERKFNNIDETFGFDHTVGPKPGAAEFVLTKVADHPIANLALLSPWAQQLFPFIALNRASPVHYDPDEFVEAIAEQLPENRDQPLFLAAHFCLAHYPYTWRTQGRRSQDGESMSIEHQHISATAVVERQIGNLIRTLEDTGRLDNAILVILSDHGESLGYQEGQWVSVENYMNLHDTFEVAGYTAFPRATKFTGHGSDVLDRNQHDVLLSFRAFGALKEKFDAGRYDRFASLVDVMPTLFGALGWSAPEGIDGIDLMAAAAPADDRVIPVETGIRFMALTSIVNIDENELLKESSAFYDVEAESARLILKPERYDEVVANKHIAVHTQDWMLALLRKDLSPVFPRVAVLVHKPTGAWTIGNDVDLIRQAPLDALIRAARGYYGSEIDDFEHTWAFIPRG